MAASGQCRALQLFSDSLVANKIIVSARLTHNLATIIIARFDDLNTMTRGRLHT